MHKKRVWSLTKIVFIILISTAIGTIAYWYVAYRGGEAHIEVCDEYYIYEFNDGECDIHDVEQLFEQELYWLTDVNTYDVRTMLARRSSDYKNPNIHNDMWIYIMRDKQSDTFIGFITFFKKTFYKGQIWFAAVSKDFRRRGYMCKLFQCAMNRMKKIGMTKICVVTRIENGAMHGVCQSLNFEEFLRRNDIVYYEKMI